jgi:hypothetical protein
MTELDVLRERLAKIAALAARPIRIGDEVIPAAVRPGGEAPEPFRGLAQRPRDDRRVLEAACRDAAEGLHSLAHDVGIGPQLASIRADLLRAIAAAEKSP